MGTQVRYDPGGVAKAKLGMQGPEVRVEFPVRVGDWARTPIGEGEVVALREPQVLDLGGYRMVLGRPMISVWIPGFSAPHDFFCHEVSPAPRPAQKGTAQAGAVPSALRKTGKAPARGKVLALLEALPERFGEREVERAVLQLVASRVIPKPRSVRRAARAWMRRLLREGLVEPA